MNTNLVKWAALAIAAITSSTATAAPAGSELNVLWYDKPATKWVEALPVGNVRLDAMIFGGVTQERLQINEDTLWAGGPYDPVNPQAREALPQGRRLINEGKYREIAKLISEKVMANPLAQMPYQTVGGWWKPRFAPSTVARHSCATDRSPARLSWPRANQPSGTASSAPNQSPLLLL